MRTLSPLEAAKNLGVMGLDFPSGRIPCRFFPRDVEAAPCEGSGKQRGRDRKRSRGKNGRCRHGPSQSENSSACRITIISPPGAYFITICTHEKLCILSDTAVGAACPSRVPRRCPSPAVGALHEAPADPRRRLACGAIRGSRPTRIDAPSSAVGEGLVSPPVDPPPQSLPRARGRQNRVRPQP